MGYKEALRAHPRPRQSCKGLGAFRCHVSRLTPCTRNTPRGCLVATSALAGSRPPPAPAGLCRVVLACLCVNQIEAVEKWARDNDLQIPWEPAGIAPRNASNDSDGRLPCCGNTLAYSQLGQRTV